MDVGAGTSSSGHVVGVSEDSCTSAVAVHVDTSLEGVLLDQADVSLVQQGVFDLQNNRCISEIEQLNVAE